MAAPTCTESELLKFIKQSGYPFELTVAETLLKNGFEVQLSQHFFNPLKQRESELDIIATAQKEGSLRTIPKIRLNLELAIECKNNALPYVLFGFPQPSRPPADLMDMDCRYVKVRSTNDKIPNELAMVAFGDIRESKPRDLKPKLHQFNGQMRYHHATQVEKVGEHLKLHESDKLRSTLGGLVGYSEYIQDTWIKNKHILDRISHDPTLWITFFLIVHNGKHYRYTNDDTLQVANQTTLLTSFHSDGNPCLIAIDFVQYEELHSALNRIWESFSHLANHLARYLKPSTL